MGSRAILAMGTCVLFMVLTSCGGGTRRAPGRDAAVDSGSCAEGEVVCMGREVHACTGGVLSRSEICPDEWVCAIGLGCRACQPGRPFCDGQEVRECDATGNDSTLTRECPISEVCSGGACIDACAAATAERSNVGCDYFAVDLDNEWATASTEQFAVVLANPSRVTIQATVFQSVGTVGSLAETQIGTPYVVPPEGLVRIDLPAREVDGSTPGTDDEGTGTFLSPNAYRIRTNFPVVAYQFNPIIQSFSNDASLLIPVPALDTHYRVLGWPTANPIAVFPLAGIPDHSSVTVIGTVPNTEVQVTLGGPILGGGGIPAASAGETVTVTLGPYDVLNLESTGIPGDLTGTVVVSNQPVAVFSGGERGIAPLDTSTISAHPSGAPGDWCCTEHLEEQVFPTSSWGTHFNITRSPVRSSHATWREPDIYRVMADKPGTLITTNLAAPNDSFTLGTNEWREFTTDRPFVMEATQAISIQQILVSQGWVVNWKDGHGGDPSMLLFPPIEQYRDDYIFLVPSTFTANYVVIAMAEGTDVQLDGMDIDADEFMRTCTYEDIGTLSGALHIAVTCPVSGDPGTHRVESSSPVGIMVYGYHSVGSYGYAGGSNLTQINFI